MNMNTMKAPGAGLGACRLGTSLGVSGRRELALSGRGVSGKEARGLVCRAIGGGKNGPKVQITYEKNLYQPFRPPVSIETPAGATTAADQLEVLRERRGLWHEYAVLIPILSRTGYTPSMIDEETGMTGVEQNIIVVGSQVRNSLKASGFDEEMLQYFDLGGGELLYELRILSAMQRKASAEFIIERKMSPKEASELARSVKDFAMRKNSEGFKEFSSAPGDCLAFAFYRQSRECQEEEEVEAALQKALDVCVTDKARAKIQETLEKFASPDVSVESEPEETVFLQVIRLLEGEVVGTKLPTMLPVADATLESVEAVPSRASQGEGLFNVFSPAGWPSWVAIPGWDTVVHAGAPVAVVFPDAAKLPLQSNKNGKEKLREPTLVIVDKSVTLADDDQSLYVAVQSDSQELSILSASKVLDNRILGRVVLALRPPFPPSEDPVDWE
ncbi:hypothetical protein M758_8G083200 [Ceratodon purpureus]|uniref:Uncharacterized protein n=1 Tax=Ceratodon purpureus TaxID=3225 RepID=A0A8T0H4W7_CERPU|nr:hypothetical protein KC19_8G087600 [Ceratodon purpureus]KAG0608155.1 hypothetical protein M758_8G083200 [Ceratodon purpureus]